MDVAMNALAVEVQARQGRHIMSGLHGLWSAGGLCGAAFGGLMAQQDVPAAAHLGGVALALALLLLVARRWLPRTPPVPSEPSPHFERPEPGMLALGAIVFCSFLIEGAMADWSAVYLKDSLGTSAGEAAWGYAAFATAMMLLRLAGDRLLQRWRGSSLLRWGNAVSALLLVTALLVRETPLVMAAFVMVGLGVAVVAPLVFGAAAKRSRRGPGHGIAAMATLGYTGFLLGPPIIGWLAHWSSLGTALLLLALLAAGISVLAGQVDRD